MPFAIGLAGEWGTGKTTILNNVKKDLASNNKIDVIDNFDPWVYSSTKSMLSGMYYSILQKTGVHYNDLQVKELVKTAIEIIEESAKVKGIDKIAKSILSQSEGNDSISILKKQIDDYLRVKNKTIVFIIDNLDRASAENVRLVFKLVGAVLDFERVKYILSYDKNRLKDIFKESLKIDSRYVEKIINQEINVPKISKETKDDIYRRCIINYLSSSGVTIERIPDYENIIQFIVDEVKNIRMFKRLINSAFFMTFGNHSLYKPDLLMLEIIRFLDLELRDTVGSSIGRKYGYRIIKGNYESLFSEDIDVQAMLEKHKPKNSSEQLIFELYQDYRNFGDSLEHQHYFDLPYNFEL